ncbi:hypothetical protein [Arenimonas sp. MALMAid1274]|uniref:hypothetical protein n=1 Tax=Arenimonas sp. MALMAid1274 TaxID=3411630 RepID=UPI003B9FAECA
MIDPLKLLRALEDFLFEAIALLFFYPVTLYRIARRPLESMQYAESEEIADRETRYDDAVSPPLLLLLTILLTTFVAQSVHAGQPVGDAPLASFIFDSPQNLLLFRCLLFSLLPLVAAVTLLRKQHQPISRDSLRPVFYAQCYLAVPLALAVTLGSTGMAQPDPRVTFAGGLGFALGFVWMIWAQTRWFSQKLAWGWLRSLGAALGVVLSAALFLILFSLGVMAL